MQVDGRYLDGVADAAVLDPLQRLGDHLLGRGPLGALELGLDAAVRLGRRDVHDGGPELPVTLLQGPVGHAGDRVVLGRLGGFVALVRPLVALGVLWLVRLDAGAPGLDAGGHLRAVQGAREVGQVGPELYPLRALAGAVGQPVEPPGPVLVPDQQEAAEGVDEVRLELRPDRRARRARRRLPAGGRERPALVAPRVYALGLGHLGVVRRQVPLEERRGFRGHPSRARLVGVEQHVVEVGALALAHVGP